MKVFPTVIAALLILGIAGCGGADDGTAPTPEERTELPAEAFEPSAGDFPRVKGRTLQKMSTDEDLLTGPQVGLATSDFTPGLNRLAFGVIDSEGKFVYGPTAVYLAQKLNQVPEGPLLAPADSLVTDGRYQSQGAATEGSSIAAIYSMEVDLPKPGKWVAVVVTKVGGELRAALVEFTVARESQVVKVGEPAPEVETDTAESVGADTELLDTRVPADDMHGTSFADVVGERPVALLFSAPALCESRVCGPVTDIALEVKQEYGDEVEFIHQEAYEENDPQLGLRQSAEAFGLPTEPWLFTIDADGRVAARLEGSFGIREFERAVQAAIDGAPQSDA